MDSLNDLRNEIAELKKIQSQHREMHLLQSESSTLMLRILTHVLEQSPVNNPQLNEVLQEFKRKLPEMESLVLKLREL